MLIIFANIVHNFADYDEIFVSADNRRHSFYLIQNNNGQLLNNSFFPLSLLLSSKQ